MSIIIEVLLLVLLLTIFERSPLLQERLKHAVKIFATIFGIAAVILIIAIITINRAHTNYIHPLDSTGQVDTNTWLECNTDCPEETAQQNISHECEPSTGYDWPVPCPSSDSN